MAFRGQMPVNTGSARPTLPTRPNSSTPPPRGSSFLSHLGTLSLLTWICRAASNPNLGSERPVKSLLSP